MNAATPDGLEVAPAHEPEVRARARLGGRRRAGLAALVIAAAIGFVVFQGLGNATVYFKTADEAVAEKDELGSRRFRVEGAVVDGSVRPFGDTVEFQIISAGQRVDVVHRGDPPELFQDGIPVVLEGRWDGDHYASDRIMVKHTNEYREENPERVDAYVGKEQAP